ncbi:MAG TPA: serine/threonine-protein kinase [Sandaracinaceae bacterium]
MLRKLEKYEILEEIGHGGMATVYRAHDTVLDRPVALKVMHPHLRGAEEARRRFHREARSVARLRHPRVLEIYDFSGEGSSEAYIAAELLTGPTLKQWREQQADVPAEIAACFAIEIAKALEAAHAANIVHRDVKPENVLLHENRELKLTDFGIADMIDAQSMTATGQILGSPGHMAPEQIEGRDCDARTDLFSLGTVLYYLATGHLPFTGRNPHQVLKRIVDGEYADPLRVNPAIGGRLRAIIVKALERDPAQRYQSAREMIEELEAFVREGGIEDSAQMLERYLKDPATVAAQVRAQVIDRLIERGARASDAGDVPTALDYYNRVLALDEGNERVLRLIERVGVDRRRRTMLLSAAGLAAFGVISAAGAWALWPEEARERARLGPIRTPSLVDAGSDASVLAHELTSELPPAAADAGAEAAADAGAPLLATTERDAGARRPPRARAHAPSEPSLVVFAPSPESVSIGVDGQPPRVYGPGHLSVRLAPGVHRFEVVPIEPEGADSNEPLYARRTFEERIPPGEERYVLELRLGFAPALFVVESNVPAVVHRVDASGVATRLGPTGEGITVPMRSGRSNMRIRVSTADGRYAPWEGWVQLTAGRTARVSATLSPVP